MRKQESIEIVKSIQKVLKSLEGRKNEMLALQSPEVKTLPMASELSIRNFLFSKFNEFVTEADTVNKRVNILAKKLEKVDFELGKKFQNIIENLQGNLSRLSQEHQIKKSNLKEKAVTQINKTSNIFTSTLLAAFFDKLSEPVLKTLNQEHISNEHFKKLVDSLFDRSSDTHTPKGLLCSPFNNINENYLKPDALQDFLSLFLRSKCHHSFLERDLILFRKLSPDLKLVFSNYVVLKIIIYDFCFISSYMTKQAIIDDCEKFIEHAIFKVNALSKKLGKKNYLDQTDIKKDVKQIINTILVDQLLEANPEFSYPIIEKLAKNRILNTKKVIYGLKKENTDKSKIFCKHLIRISEGFSQVNLAEVNSVAINDEDILGCYAPCLSATVELIVNH